MGQEQSFLVDQLPPEQWKLVMARAEEMVIAAEEEMGIAPNEVEMMAKELTMSKRGGGVVEGHVGHIMPVIPMVKRFSLF